MLPKHHMFTNTTVTSGNTCAAFPQACINAQSNISNHTFALDAYPAKKQMINTVPNTGKNGSNIYPPSGNPFTVASGHSAHKQMTSAVPSTCKKRSIHEVNDDISTEEEVNDDISTEEEVNDDIPTEEEVNAFHDQFVKLKEIFPLDTNSVLRELVKYIICTHKLESNQLQPTNKQYLLLRCVIENYCMINLHDLSNREWLDIINDDDILMSIVTQDTKADLKIRAKAIVNALINSGEKHVTLMDGHGRMLYQILCELSERIPDVNEYTFTLYDLNSNITNWHNIFLPSSVESIYDDILCIAPNELREIEGVLYLNYCGIGSNCNATLAMIDKFAAKKSPIMVSYSVRGKSNHTKTNFWEFQKKANKMTKKPNKNGLCSELVSGHGKGSNTFLTYAWYLQGHSHFNDVE